MSRILTLILLLPCITAPAQAAQWGPWDNMTSREKNEIQRKDAPDFNPLKSGVWFFQRFISPVDGPRCRMYPTCSAYALEALDKHGPLLGAMMTVDRLFHESDPREHRHPIQFGNRLRFHDPVENNDFWISSFPFPSW